MLLPRALKLSTLAMLLIAQALVHGQLSAQVFKKMASPELERLERALAPYQLPAPKGISVIPKFDIQDISLQEFTKTLKETYSITAVATKSVRDQKISIRLRQLPLNRCLDFATIRINVMWIYQDGRIIFCANEDELDLSAKNALTEKLRIQQLIYKEDRRLRRIEANGNEPLPYP